MAYELNKRGLTVIAQKCMPVVYEDIKLERGFRADLLINGKAIVELKSVDALAPIHRKQLATYLRLADIRLGLLINFNVELIKDGIRRVVNQLAEKSHSPLGCRYFRWQVLAKAQRRTGKARGVQ